MPVFNFAGGVVVVFLREGFAVLGGRKYPLWLLCFGLFVTLDLLTLWIVAGK